MLFDHMRATLVQGLVYYCLASANLPSVSAAALVQGAAFDEPKVAAASNEGELAMKQFVLPPGFKVELFAAEPLLANPVAFHIDERGRFFVCETFRHSAGVTDIRGHMNWLDEDLASRTVEDRLAMLKRHEGINFPNYSRRTDRLRLLWDSDNDGKADSATIFADGFTNALSGIGSGVLTHQGDVYYGNLPDLWRLRDLNADGKADQRQSLLYGFGVRVGFLGHDLHGLTLGPDGKIYFTIGDRGASVIQGDHRVGEPDTGAVYRCNPDGSEFEVFCFGLRNPQELAFDQFGNLFTVDNNSDGGDRARALYLVEGADYGWRIGYQFIERPNSRGPWNSEKLWHPQWEGQAAYLLPAIANITDGPSGLAYYPGTGLPEKYRDNFLIVDFHGGRGSGIYAFSLQQSGAGFSLEKTEKLIWESLPTDVAFGPDGSIYFTDWVQGWSTTGKGRIYKVTHIEANTAPLVSETKELLLTPMGKRNVSALSKLLAHPDMRVRQGAQMELAQRGARGAQAFAAVASKSTSTQARLHAAWGLGLLARKQGPTEQEKLLKPVQVLLRDENPEIAAQAAKLLGDLKATYSSGDLLAALTNKSPRVRLQAALALGKLKERKAVPALLQVLDQNNNQDRYLRHAASTALAWIGSVEPLIAAAKSDSPGIRMGALLALRRLERSEISAFLNDSEPLIATEAARAINDLPISGAMAELASLQSRSPISVELARRIVNANYREGTRESAKRLTALSLEPAFPEVARVEALNGLANWQRPSGRDRVTGLWRPLSGARQQNHATEALKPVVTRTITEGPEAVRLAAIEAGATLRLGEAGDALLASFKSTSTPTLVRVRALAALATLQDARLGEALQIASTDQHENLRKEALRILSETQSSGAFDRLSAVLQSGTIGEQQSALGTLANMSDSAADEILLQQLELLLSGKAPREIQLDIVEAAAKRNSKAIKDKLAAYEAALPKDDPLAPFRITLHGGNAEEGRKIFIERAEAACLRCHKIPGAEGGEVGPNLSKIGEVKPREYLLEAMVQPNAHIAEGFETLIVETRDGLFHAGIVKSENETDLVLNSPEDGIVTIKRDSIAKRQKGLSSMPEGLSGLLSRKDIRDLVEFLAGLR